MKPVTLGPFTLADCEEACALWQGMAGIALSDADARPAITRFLERNPGTSFVAREGAALAGRLIGTVLAGSDGRRGYLHHLAVHPACRRRGIGRELVDAALGALRGQGIRKCHLFLVRGNADGEAFWRAGGWVERTDLQVFSKNLE